MQNCPLNKLISTIVTVHNSEQYIHECMESLLNQTYANLEILCIDGGSTDKTPEILEAYAEKDSRVRIIQDENTSYGHKINRGIQEAHGEYISVLEADDYYDTDMLAVLYKIMEKEDVDFVNADYHSFFDIGSRRCSSIVHMYGPDEYNKVIENDLSSRIPLLISRYWTGLFKKSFLVNEGIMMNESPGASYQDMSFRFLISVLAKRMYHLDQALYWYRTDNPGSSMHDSEKTVVIADEHDYLWNELRRRGITDEWVWHEALQWKYQDFFGNMAYLNLKGENRNRLFQRYRAELEKDQGMIKQYRLCGFRGKAEGMTEWGEEEAARQIDEASCAEEIQHKELWEILQRVAKEKNGVVLFGCLGRGRRLFTYMVSMGLSSIGAADNAERLVGNKIDGCEVWKPEKAVSEMPDALYVITSRKYKKEMKEQLLALGISNRRIVCW